MLLVIGVLLPRSPRNHDPRKGRVYIYVWIHIYIYGYIYICCMYDVCSPQNYTTSRLNCNPALSNL